MPGARRAFRHQRHPPRQDQLPWYIRAHAARSHRDADFSTFDIAQRFVGIAEIPGHKDSPQVLAMLRLDETWPENDEVPWCSAFLNYVAWLLRLPRSKSLRARS